MKKIIFIMITIIILITGCNEDKKITCTSNGKTDDMAINQKYILTIEGNNIIRVKSEKEYIFKNNDLYDSFETIVNNSKSNIEELGNAKIKFDTKKTKDSYKLTMEVNMKDVDEKEMTSLGLNKNLDEFKTILEEQGLTCK